MKPNAKPQALSSWNSAHLDVVRSLATLAVVAEHTFRLFFATGNLPPTVLAMFAQACSRIADESVMVFFVLSGFFISAIVKRSFGSWTWKRYLIDRLSRLYVVLLPALLFTAIIDWLTDRTPGGAFILNHPLTPFLNAPIAEHHTAGIFWGNLFFLQLVRVPAFGSDLPLWSLSNEFWYYMMFPCACLALAAPVIRKRVIAGLLIACFIIFFPRQIVKYMLIWLFGALVYWLPSIQPNKLLRNAMLILAPLGTVIVLFAHSLASTSQWHLDLAFSTLFAVWLFSLVRTGHDETPVSPVYRRLGAGFAACSYSVYVTHFPVLLFARSWKSGAPWALTPATAMQGLGLVVSVTLFGWIFSRATEAHTQAARKILIKVSECDYGRWWSIAANHVATALSRSQQDPAASEDTVGEST